MSERLLDNSNYQSEFQSSKMEMLMDTSTELSMQIQPETRQEMSQITKLETFKLIRSSDTPEDMFIVFENEIEPVILESKDNPVVIAVTAKHATYKGTLQQGLSRILKRSKSIEEGLRDQNMDLELVEVQTSLFREVAIAQGRVTEKPLDQFDDYDWEETSALMLESIRNRWLKVQEYNKLVDLKNSHKNLINSPELRKKKVVFKIEGGYANSIPIIDQSAHKLISIRGQDRGSRPIFELMLDPVFGHNFIGFYNQAMGVGTIHEHEYRQKTENMNDDELINELYKNNKKYYFTNSKGYEQDISLLPESAQMAIARFLNKTRGSSSSMSSALLRHSEISRNEGIYQGNINILESDLNDPDELAERLESFEKEDYKFARYFKMQLGKYASKFRIMISSLSSDEEKWINLDYFWKDSLAEDEMRLLGKTIIPPEIKPYL